DRATTPCSPRPWWPAVSTLRDADSNPSAGPPGPADLLLSALPARMIDQDQARKFWTSWVRREIGGSDMIQGAAVSAAINELLLGHDNQAAADAARNTARQLAGGVSTPHPDPPPRGGREAVPIPPPPTAPGGTARAVAGQIPAALSPGKSQLRRPWLYLGGVAGVAATAIVVIFVVRSAPGIGCLVSQTTLGHRMTTVHNAFVD